MKKKLCIALLIGIALSIVVSFQVVAVMKGVSFKLENIISIYKIQSVREKLSFQLRKVHEEFVSINSPYKIMQTDTILTEVETMDRIMHSCFDCHHEPEVDKQLKLINHQMEMFKTALSRVFTLRANSSRYLQASRLAYNLGDRLLWQVDEMTARANAKLEKRSNAAMADVLSISKLMTIALFVLPLFLLVAGFYFLHAISKPISTLLEATSKLGQGDLTFRTKGLQDEFAKLGNSFNTMAESLANQMAVTQRAEQMTVVGQMAVGLAHEIKNPLAGIKVSMEVIKREPYILDQDRQVLAMVIAVINRINSLINDLLKFARPSEPCLQSIPINSLLEQITDSATHSLTHTQPAGIEDGKPPLTCTTVLAPDLPPVQADIGHVQQIVLNLILNAFEAMPEGGTVTISSALAARPGFIAVTISDSGPGISADVRDKIFVPFYSTKKKGTGLGLAICLSLAQKNGGTVLLHDSANGGASFSLYLPIAGEQGAPA